MHLLIHYNPREKLNSLKNCPLIPRVTRTINKFNKFKYIKKIHELFDFKAHTASLSLSKPK